MQKNGFQPVNAAELDIIRLCRGRQPTSGRGKDFPTRFEIDTSGHEQPLDPRVGHRVHDLFATAIGLENAFLPQDLQVLANRRLGQAKALPDLANVAFAREKSGDNLQPNRVPKHLQQLPDLLPVDLAVHRTHAKNIISQFEHTSATVTIRGEVVMSKQQTRKHVRISGRVQGVFFRASTRDKARELGLAGWVRNCSDGTVKLMVEGPVEQVDRLLSWCHEGPPSARVESVDAEEGNHGEALPDPFEVRH